MLVPIDVERHGPVALITINRPDALNAMSVELLGQLETALTEADGDPGVRSIVLTGAGEKAFCAGADVGHMREASAIEAREFAALGHRVTGLIETMGTPVVAAVNGFALGGGCEIALSCDIRMAAEGARFGQPEVNLGILPGWGGTQRLARTTSVGLAKDLILTGRLVKAPEALATGLVTHVHPGDDLMTKALELAAGIAAKPSSATAAAKAMCNLALGGDSTEPLAREMDTFALAFTTPDQREGMAAFLEKRAPQFAGHADGTSA
ncbi:MAG: enoyl-CoA hydratase-related protein [Miltoncostaeaceae bacterium]